ncbi:MAG: 16S rRNA (uracil(1498)-N(3))-methyltransferase [Candidatus Omnitrophica bacterium]|nr:16S rRNA (uracil(1498)-N(3))-methyltransferase [Candidatus Omnitrophota bacterium]
MRFYVQPDSIFPLKNIIEIKDKTEVHHIRDVMRLRKGDAVNIFDGQGREFACFIEELKKESITIKIKEALDFKREPNFNITLYQAIPKKAKMDFIVEKAVELGVAKLVPVITDRTVPEIKDFSKKIERWNRIAMASSKQCGRRVLPIIADVLDFNSALIDSKQKELTIFASIDKESRPLKDILKGLNPKSIAVFVGPEGDFSPRETYLAREKGHKICSLGSLILKSETAAIYILSCLSYESQ